MTKTRTLTPNGTVDDYVPQMWINVNGNKCAVLAAYYPGPGEAAHTFEIRGKDHRQAVLLSTCEGWQMFRHDCHSGSAKVEVSL